jgi:hypothetical protein
MKSPIAALALFGTLAVNPVWAQTQPQDPVPGAAQPGAPRSAIGGAANAPGGTGNRLVPVGGGLPELTPVSDLRPPTVALPNEPVEGYLLTKEDGPFMVMARVFRGPDAERMALALVKELRNDFGLPAYILRTKDFPGRSLMRGTPPTVPSQVMVPDIKMPEKIRTFDEAAVLVGNEKTLAAQEKLWNKVKKLKPKCLEGVSSPSWWRSGLSSALRTTNPYVPAQHLFPQARDRLVVQMNAGLRSIANCPGRFSLQVADFSGRSSFQLNRNVSPTQLLPNLSNSPLRKAADDAERLAEKLAKAPEIQRLGQPIYVYHDRTTSKVFVGSFNHPQDPAAVALRQALLVQAVPLASKKIGERGPVDTMIVPALALTDLTDIKGKLKN